MNFDSIPDNVWKLLAGIARAAGQSGIAIPVMDHFYDLYEQGSGDTVDYTPNVRGKGPPHDTSWAELADMLKPTRGPSALSTVFNDTSVGEPFIQEERGGGMKGGKQED